MAQNPQEPIGNKTLATLLKPSFGFVDSMALKCAIELGIADIINAHGHPISIPRIASHFASPKNPNPDLTCLSRVMQVLVRREIFTAENPTPNTDTLYWLTPASRLLLQDNPDASHVSYAPMVLMLNHPKLLASWHFLSRRIKEGGVPFEMAHGRSIWDMMAVDQEVNKVFHDGLACAARIGFRIVVSEYQHVFSAVGSVVDVGGGTGAAAAEIVKAYPKIKAINFDLPHVIAMAPKHEGVTHVAGDMFKGIPNADVAILKAVLHDWSDEDCLKILTNCRKAIPEKTGKIIISEQVMLEQGGEVAMEDIVYASDLLMIAHTGGGKERTLAQFETLLQNAGFPRRNFIATPGFPSIIEAYPRLIAEEYEQIELINN